MELKLNFSEILVRLGYDSKLEGYLNSICYFNRRIGPELSGNRNMILTWNVSANNRSGFVVKAKPKPKAVNLNESVMTSAGDDGFEVEWPSIKNGDNLENRIVLNALEYCFLKRR